MITTFFLIRHGDKIRTVGDPALSERGVEQARQTGAFLSSQPIEVIAASPLLRTQQTAQYIAEPKNLPVQTESLLRERVNWGDDPNQSFESFVEMWQRGSRERTWQPPVGDSSVTAGNRVRYVVENFPLEYRCGALVSHGGVISDFLLNAFSTEELESVRPGFPLMRDNMVKECSITKFTYDSVQEQYQLFQVANTDHLQDLHQLV